jgi:uncharacterized protein YsxB (DUF464 family)
MSEPEIQPYSLKQSLHCPNCKADINVAAGITPGHSHQSRKGQIVVCAACAAPSIVGDGDLEALTEVRFKQLDPRTQRAVKITVNKLKEITAQNQQGN